MMDEEPTSLLLLLLYTTEEPGSESQILGYRLLDIGGKADIGGYFVFTRYPPLDTLHTFCPTVYDDKILFISFTRSRMEMRGSATYTPGAWTLPMMKMCVCVCLCVCVYVCILWRRWCCTLSPAIFFLLNNFGCQIMSLDCTCLSRSCFRERVSVSHLSGA